jgi:hypothetical protein
MSVSLHRLIKASMGSFPAVFVAPSRNREYLDTFLYTLQRWSLVPIGDWWHGDDGVKAYSLMHGNGDRNFYDQVDVGMCSK